jgi:Uma2 family endonuclease
VATITQTAKRGRRTKLPSRRLFNVDEYYRMAEKGILQPDERVELIEGEIIEMAALGSPHGGCVMALNAWFLERIRGRAILGVQTPVRLSQRSEPEPDVMLLRPRRDYYRERHPEAEDVLLLIEVSDTSLRYDRGTKLPLYAREGVPEVWIVDLTGQRVEAYRTPLSGRYQESVVHDRGSSLAPAVFRDLIITVDEILG